MLFCCNIYHILLRLMPKLIYVLQIREVNSQTHIHAILMMVMFRTTLKILTSLADALAADKSHRIRI